MGRNHAMGKGSVYERRISRSRLQVSLRLQVFDESTYCGVTGALCSLNCGDDTDTNRTVWISCAGPR